MIEFPPHQPLLVIFTILQITKSPKREVMKAIAGYPSHTEQQTGREEP